MVGAAIRDGQPRTSRCGYPTSPGRGAAGSHGRCVGNAKGSGSIHSVAVTPEIRCPAGTYEIEPARGPGVRCGVDKRHIAVADNPRSVTGFCSTHYERCPVWIAERTGDPLADAARGSPQLRKCPECRGTGVDRVEVFVSGIYVPDEIPCDMCVGSGQVPHSGEIDKQVASDEEFLTEQARLHAVRGKERLYVKGGDA